MEGQMHYGAKHSRQLELTMRGNPWLGNLNTLGPPVDYVRVASGASAIVPITIAGSVARETEEPRRCFTNEVPWQSGRKK